MKNQKQYTEDCLRTWKQPNTSLPELFDSGEFRGEVQDTAEHLQHDANLYEELAHTIAGISGEILSELEFAFAARDQQNIKEEIGDIQYHILVAARRYGVDLTHIDETTPTLYNNASVAKFCLDSPFKAVKYHAGEFIDVLKRIYIYKSNKFNHQDLSLRLQELQIALYRLAMKNGFTPESAIEAVIAKLKVRYADKFSVSEADNRNLEGEREALG